MLCVYGTVLCAQPLSIHRVALCAADEVLHCTDVRELRTRAAERSAVYDKSKGMRLLSAQTWSNSNLPALGQHILRFVGLTPGE